MCELFAVSSDTPVRLTYELSEFATHGGRRFQNRDGWGILFSQPRDAYLFKEPTAGATSALEHMVATQPPLSQMVMAHVRRATAGSAALCNTHPFQRAVAGEIRSFAHNGDLPQLREQYAGRAELLDCVGETDSELAFMILLASLSRLNGSAALSDRFEVFAQFCHEMRQLGDSNFLYAEGETLFVHSDKREYEESDGRLTRPRPPDCMFARSRVSSLVGTSKVHPSKRRIPVHNCSSPACHWMKETGRDLPRVPLSSSQAVKCACGSIPKSPLSSPTPAWTVRNRRGDLQFHRVRPEPPGFLAKRIQRP